MPLRPPTHRPAGSRPGAARHAYNVSESRRAHQQLYDHAWRIYSARRLIEHPYCVRCMAENKLRPAVVTDHVIPHRGDRALFVDSDNHQSLCKLHHDAKTATEDGGFGRAPSAGVKPARRALLVDHEQTKHAPPGRAGKK